jgi:RNA polymerase sigma-70 factor (ECF subfamily)
MISKATQKTGSTHATTCQTIWRLDTDGMAIPNDAAIVGQTGERRFLVTRWSLVLAAGGDGVEAHAALEQLCRIYWYPLYAYIRQQGRTAPDAQDLTQEFFAQLLTRRDLARIQREKGRFRSFLLASLTHFLANERKKANRLKRGGGQVLVSIDAAIGERRYASEPSHELDPQKLFERRWAIALLEQAVDTLRQEFVKSGKSSLFEQLKVFLTGDNNGPRYADVGANVGLSEAAVKMAVSRLRRRYRQVLLTQIECTVPARDDVEDELRYLFAALG